MIDERRGAFDGMEIGGRHFGLHSDTRCEKPELWHGPTQRKYINIYNQHGHDIIVPVGIPQSV
jgi:hypothetical protein